MGNTHRFRCRHCRRLIARRTETQRYCDAKACQRARKNRWRRERYASDPDYRANQRDSNAAWLASQGGIAAYHRAYRRRCQGRKDVLVGDLTAGAKRDGKPVISVLNSGTYRLIAVGDAKRDALLVNLRIISDTYADFTNIDSLDSDRPSALPP